ncbi:MAG: hypothetical protein LBO70_01010 [Clostridiales Family XIII bacterium]|jgi:hypothetical protein|nr:hypothetical protein [Clostridiales Family XIII bacterium]
MANRLRKLDLDEYEHRESLVRVFVNAIYVYDDHIVLVLNYMDNAQTISLAEVEGAGFGADAISAARFSPSSGNPESDGFTPPDVGSDLGWFGAP